MTDGQPPQAETKRKRNLNPKINGTLSKLVFAMLSIGGAVFLLMAGLVGNAVLDAVAAQVRVQEALADRLRVVETSVAEIKTNRFTSTEGLQLELRLTERIAESVDRIEAKIDRIDGGGT